jgi:hypothetical protein
VHEMETSVLHPDKITDGTVGQSLPPLPCPDPRPPGASPATSVSRLLLAAAERDASAGVGAPGRRPLRRDQPALPEVRHQGRCNHDPKPFCDRGCSSGSTGDREKRIVEALGTMGTSLPDQPQADQVAVAWLLHHKSEIVSHHHHDPRRRTHGEWGAELGGCCGGRRRFLSSGRRGQSGYSTSRSRRPRSPSRTPTSTNSWQNCTTRSCKCEWRSPLPLGPASVADATYVFSDRPLCSPTALHNGTGVSGTRGGQPCTTAASGVNRPR